MSLFHKSLITSFLLAGASTTALAQHDFYRSFQKEIGHLVIPNATSNPDLVTLAIEPNFDHSTSCTLGAAESVMAGPASWDLHRHAFMSMDFDRVGGMQVLADDEILLSGSKTTSASPYTAEGKIYRIKVSVDNVNPVAFTILQQVTLPGIDPWRVAWNKNTLQLHILDYPRRRLVHATWDRDSNAPLPSSYSVVADPNGHLAAVLDPIAYTYVAMTGIGSELEPYTETNFFVGNSATDEMLDVDYQVGSHVLTPFSRSPFEADVLVLEGDKTFFGPNLPLQAEIANMSLPSATIELRDAVTAQVLDTVQATPGQTLQFSGYASAFQDDPGRVYLLRDPSGQVGGQMFRSQLRYGQPQNKPEFSIGLGMIPAYGASPAYPFGIGVEFRHDGSLPQVAGNLLVGFRQENGTGYTDPVSFNGTQADLTPTFSVPFSFDPTAQGATIGHELPLDDSHVGQVVLFQYQFGWIDSDGLPQTVISDVFGTRVIAEPWVDPNTVQWD